MSRNECCTNFLRPGHRRLFGLLGLAGFFLFVATTAWSRDPLADDATSPPDPASTETVVLKASKLDSGPLFAVRKRAGVGEGLRLTAVAPGESNIVTLGIADTAPGIGADFEVEVRDQLSGSSNGWTVVPSVTVSTGTHGTNAWESVATLPMEMDLIFLRVRRIGRCLVERTQFACALRDTVTVPTEPAHLRVEFSDLLFDTTSESVRDAFEIALVDAAGTPLVHTIRADRDAAFNWTEGMEPVFGTNTQPAGMRAVTFDLSHLAPGTEVTVISRLVNNDRDEGSQVCIGQVSVQDGGLGTPLAIPAGRAELSEPLDSTGLTDISARLDAAFGQTSFDEGTAVLHADLMVSNRGNACLFEPLVVVAEGLDPAVFGFEPDGRTAAGDPFFRLARNGGSGRVAAGETLSLRGLRFLNLPRERFGFSLRFLGVVAAAPELTGTPGSNAWERLTYSYEPRAASGANPLAWSLPVAPDGMTVDADNGTVTWTPETDATGTHSVVLLATDACGQQGAQAWMVQVDPTPPNRSPIIVSDPPVVVSVSCEIPEDPTPVQFGSWTTIQYQVPGGQSDANWQVQPGGTTVFQSVNSDPSIFIGDFDSVGERISGRFSSSDKDDDFMGFVFGFQNRREFYLFDWKRRTQNYGLVGMSVKIVHSLESDDGGKLWPTYGDTNVVRNIFHNSIPYLRHVEYDFELTFIPGQFTIRILEGTNVLEDVTLFDDTYTSGRFGFYNYSQDSTLYRGFARQRTDAPPFSYPVEAIDPDLDPITYDLPLAPPGMIINPESGLATWHPPPESVGIHTVRVSAADGNGGLAEQEFLLRVTPPPGDLPPLILSAPPTAVSVFGGPTTYTYQMLAVDPEVRPITFAKIDGPTNLQVNAFTGQVTWPVDTPDLGDHPVTLVARDACGSVATQRFVITVTDDEPGAICGQVYIDENRNGTSGRLNVIVPGTSNPWLAGMPDGTSLSGDQVPDQSPQLVDLVLTPGMVLRFAAGGLVGFDSVANTPPDGTAGGGHGPVHGISGITVGNNSLLGVFLGPDQPDLATNLPPRLNYLTETPPAGEVGVVSGRNFLVQSPELQQVFWIGDGFNDSGAVQQTIVPEGATRLFLGTLDGTGWFNNSGFFSVDVLTEESDPPLGDQVVFLDRNQNGRPEPGEPQTTTGTNGVYRFEGLPPGSYTVASPVPAGYEWFQPTTGLHQAEVLVGTVHCGFDFSFVALPPVSNTPPVFVHVPSNQTLQAGQSIIFQLLAFDPNDTNLVYDLPIAAEGMYVEPASGLFTYRAPPGAGGEQTALFRVQDPFGGVDLHEVTFTLPGLNYPPVIQSVPVGPAGVGLPYEYRVVASDANDDPLSYGFVDAGPPGAMIDPNTGIITWTPGSGDLGDHLVQIQVGDGFPGNVGYQTYTLMVLDDPPNRDPQFRSLPRTWLRFGDPWIYRLDLIDPDGDPLTVTLAEAPAGMTLDPVTRMLDWVPGAADLGEHTLRITADDGRGGVVEQVATLRVSSQPVNAAPRITSDAVLSAVQGNPYLYAAIAVDPDNDTLSWNLVEAPAGMVVDEATGAVTWQPPVLGDFPVLLQVTDLGGAFSEQAFTVSVRDGNGPPLILSVPSTEAVVNQGYVYLVEASDPEGDSLAYALAAGPAGVTIDPLTGVLTWTPTAGQEGTQTLTLVVSDPFGGAAEQTFAVVVQAASPNQPPRMVSVPQQFVTEGDLWTYQAEAIDPEGQALTYTLENGPAAMTIDGAGLLNWQTEAGDLGPHVVVVVARDPAGAGSIQTFSLTVIGPNEPPVILSRPPTMAVVGAPFRYDAIVEDPDGDFLRYRLVQGPAGMEIDGVGRMFWLPDTGGAMEDVRFEVDDGRGGVTQQMFTLTIGNDTVPPQVALQVSENPIAQSNTLGVIVTSVDNAGPPQLALLVNGAPVPLDVNGAAGVPATEIGTLMLTAIATDAAGNAATQTLDVLVFDPNDMNGPVVEIAIPGDDAMISAPSNAIGTVTDGNLLEWRLVLLRYPDGSFVRTIATGNTEVNNSILGSIDPTMLENGSYLLRLEAIDAGGNAAADVKLIHTTGQLKMGNFQLQFVDLTLPVSGLDLQIVRTYDTLTAHRRDEFGFGWRLEFRDTDLTISLPSSGLEDFDYYTPFRVGTRVYITLPGGRREGFTFSPTFGGGFGPLAYFRPRFIADRGVTSRLTVRSANIQPGADGFYTFGGQPYHPGAFDFGQRFFLTTVDGTVYTIDANSGDLLNVRDRNDNTLTFSDGGVVSSTGQNIEFRRDAQGRIVEVIDPLGNVIGYAYDNAGDLVGVTDREGNLTQYSYFADPAHYLDEIMDPLNRPMTRNAYGPDGRLTQTVNVDGLTFTYSSDPNARSETAFDGQGAPQVFEYDMFGNPVRIIDALGGEVTLTYDNRNFLLSETDPMGRRVEYTRDANGLATSTTDALGNTQRVEFDRSGQILQQVDELGETTSYQYDSRGNVITRVNADGGMETFVNDDRGNRVEMTSPLGHVSRVERDSAGNVVKRIDPSGAETIIRRNANGQVLAEGVMRTVNGVPTFEEIVAVRNANGDMTSIISEGLAGWLLTYDQARNNTHVASGAGVGVGLEYGGRGDLTGFQLQDGTSMETANTPRGEVSRVVGRNGEVSELEYTPTGLATELRGPDETPGDDSDNPRVSMTYNAAGQPTTVTLPIGEQLTFAYDPAGRPASVEGPTGTYATHLDARGNTDVQESPEGVSHRRLYDAMGRESGQVWNDGAQLTQDYDSDGNLTRIEDPNGGVVMMQYDGRGMQTSKTDEVGNKQQFEWDEARNWVAHVDGRGGRTERTYSAQGQLESVRQPLGQITQFAYDEVGRFNRIDLPAGQSVEFLYDTMSQVTNVVLSDGTQRPVRRNGSGQVEAIELEPGQEIQFEFDFLNRLVRKTMSDGAFIEYAYDADDNIVSRTTANGTTRYQYSYDRLIQSVEDPDGGMTRYTYDGNRRLVGVQHPNGLVETRTLDPNRDWPLNIVYHDAGGDVVEEFHYTYDLNGNIIQVRESGGVQHTFAYDASDRLIKEIRDVGAPGERTLAYEYDSGGNRTTLRDSVNGDTTYQYDNNERLVEESSPTGTITYSWNDNGELLEKSGSNGRTETYAWSPDGRLMAVRKFSGATQTDLVEFKYDHFGNRIYERVNGVERTFLIDTEWPNSRLLEIHDSNGTLEQSFVYGDRPLSTTVGGSRLTYTVDLHSGVRSVVNAAADRINSYTYDAFGQTKIKTETVPNPLRYRGEYEDDKLGLINLRSRWMDARVGRFISEDPLYILQESPQPIHRYSYARNNPLMFEDPSGEFVGSVVEFVVTHKLQIAIAAISVGVLQAISARFEEDSLVWEVMRTDFAYTPVVKFSLIGLNLRMKNCFDRKRVTYGAAIGLAVGVKKGALAGFVFDEMEMFSGAFLNVGQENAGVNAVYFTGGGWLASGTVGGGFSRGNGVRFPGVARFGFASAFQKDGSGPIRSLDEGIQQLRNIIGLGGIRPRRTKLVVGGAAIVGAAATLTATIWSKTEPCVGTGP